MPDSARSRRNITLIELALARLILFKDLLVTVRLVKNWYDLLFFKYGIKKDVTIVTRSGRRYRIKNEGDYFDFVDTNAIWALEQARLMPSLVSIGKNTIRIKTLGKTVLLFYDSSVSLGNSVHLAMHQLIGQEYSFLEVRGKDVIDVGASIGDTAINFALKGARHVYAFEPIPKAYALAKKNISMNHLNDKITIANKAVGLGRAAVKIPPDTAARSKAMLEESASNKGKKIEVLSLDDIVKDYRIKGGVLKVDCEGCEYAALLNTPNTELALFDQILIEYHYGYLDLEKKLEGAGFEVRHTMPKYAGYYVKHDRAMHLGLLFATNLGFNRFDTTKKQ